jgi:hypothetical protein
LTEAYTGIILEYVGRTKALAKERVMATTYRTMDVSDLGDNCTEAELRWFHLACECRQGETGETDAEVTEWMWGADGDWSTRARRYAHPALVGGDWLEVEG